MAETRDINYQIDMEQIIDKVDGKILSTPESTKITANDVNTLKQGIIEVRNKLDEAVIDAVGLVSFSSGEIINQVAIATDVINPAVIYKKGTIDAKLEDINASVEVESTINDNQDNRLDEIEDVLASGGIQRIFIEQITSSINIPQTPITFLTAPAATTSNPDSENFTYNAGIFTFKSAGQLTFIISSNFTENVGSVISLNVGVYKNSDDSILKQKTITLDFTGGVSIGTSGIAITFEIPDTATPAIPLNVKLGARTTTVGNIVAISNFTIVADFLPAKSGGSTIINTFEDITNDTDAPGANGKEVIDNIQETITNLKSSDIGNDVSTNPSLGLNTTLGDLINKNQYFQLRTADDNALMVKNPNDSSIYIFDANQTSSGVARIKDIVDGSLIVHPPYSWHLEFENFGANQLEPNLGLPTNIPDNYEWVKVAKADTSTTSTNYYQLRPI